MKKGNVFFRKQDDDLACLDLTTRAIEMGVKVRTIFLPNGNLQEKPSAV